MYACMLGSRRATPLVRSIFLPSFLTPFLPTARRTSDVFGWRDPPTISSSSLASSPSRFRRPRRSDSTYTHRQLRVRVFSGRALVPCGWIRDLTHSLEHLPHMATHSLEHLPNMATHSLTRGLPRPPASAALDLERLVSPSPRLRSTRRCCCARCCCGVGTWRPARRERPRGARVRRRARVHGCHVAPRVARAGSRCCG